MTSAAVLIVVKVLASITALYMCLCPAPTLYRIYKRKSTGHMPLLPLVAQWTYNHIWMLYGFLTDAYFPLFITYAIGSALSVGFLGIYYYASAQEDRSYVSQLFALATLFNIATSGYAFLGPLIQQTSQVIQMIGFVAIGCGLALYASPFATIRLVVQTKNASSIPIGMVLVGTVSNATWIVYGVLARDLIIVCPTVANTFLCVAQVVLYLVYRPSKNRRKDAELSHGTSTSSAGSLSDATSPNSSSSEHELSFVMLETPRYQETPGNKLLPSPIQTAADLA